MATLGTDDGLRSSAGSLRRARLPGDGVGRATERISIPPAKGACWQRTSKRHALSPVGPGCSGCEVQRIDERIGGIQLRLRDDHFV